MPETPAIYFSTLEIENIRCFGERQVLNLTDNGRPARWTLLIGENGAGKTTLLECLAWMRPVPEVGGRSGAPAGLDRTPGYDPLVSGRLKSALTQEENEVLQTLPRVGAHAVNLGAKLSFGSVGFYPESKPSQAKDIRLSVQLRFGEHAQLLDLKPTRVQIKRLGNSFPDPLIVSYGANRSLGDRNSLGVDDLDPCGHQRLSRRTELYDIEEILMSLHYAATVNPSATRMS